MQQRVKYSSKNPLSQLKFPSLNSISANMEKEIHEYLLQNGVFLDQKTRMFLANIREVMGATSRRAKRAATAIRP